MDKKTVLVHYRPLAVFALGLICGIFCSSQGGTLTVCASVAAVLLFIYGIAYRKKASIILAAAFLLGLVRILSAAPDYLTFSSDEIPVRGEIYSVSADDAVLIDAYAGGRRLNGKLKIPAVSYEVGDRISFTACVRSADGAFNEKQLLSQGIFYSAQDISHVIKTGEAHNLNRLAGEVRNHIRTVINRCFGDSAPIVNAIVINDKTAAYEDVSAYRNAGLAHLLALSGLHVNLLALILQLVLRPVHKRIRLVITFFVILIYAFIVGFPPAFVRSLIFLGLQYIAFFTLRRYDPMSALGLAAVIILAINPYMLYSAAFLLSFTSVLSLILITDPVNSFLKVNELSGFQLSVSFTLTASIGIIPISCALFRTVPIYSPFVNLICLPFAFIAILGAYVGVTLGLIFAPLCIPFAFISNALFGFIGFVTEAVGSIPMSVINIRSVTAPLVILLLIGEFFVSDYFFANRKTKAFCFSLTIILAVCLVMFGFTP